MARYPNSGTLSKNDKKGNARAPDYKGQAEIGGTEYWISAWVKDGKEGDKFLSLAFEEKKARAGIAPSPRRERDEDIPF